MEAYMGTVFYFAGNFAPTNFATCTGQTLAISQYNALFAVIGTTFGGNGQQTFQLPHLGGRVAVGTGQSPGVTHNYQIGEISGVEQATMTIAQMPTHVHPFSATLNIQGCTGVDSSEESAAPFAGACFGTAYDLNSVASTVIYAPANMGTPVNLAGGTVAGNTGAAGGNQPFSLMQPYLGLTALICTQGLFPSRN